VLFRKLNQCLEHPCTDARTNTQAHTHTPTQYAHIYTHPHTHTQAHTHGKLTNGLPWTSVQNDGLFIYTLGAILLKNTMGS